jgi:hypothetical protein
VEILQLPAVTTLAREAEKFALLEAVAKESLLETQQAGKRLITV